MQRLTDLSPKRLALLALDLQERLKKAEGAAREPVAIVGMACNLPGAPSVGAYWDLLSSGRDGISEMPGNRWDVDAFYSPDPDEPGRYYTRHAGFIEGHDQFDPAFFGLSPTEAHNIDPQHRLLLETTWHALEDAGLPRGALEGRRVGNFVGISTTDYMQYNVRHGQRTQINPFLGTGNSASTAAGRVSYVLGLNGPSLAVDTACSSSLIAAHLACQSLRLRESDVAIASGVNLMVIPDTFIYFCKLRALAADGRCKTFDAGADGYGRGEGAGAVILKRLSDAERDGDRIIALIRGSDMNHSGRSNGLTVPSGKAQEAVVRTALANAGLTPEQVSFIEAHGTGTSLGDPIELHALGAVHRKRQDRLMIGSAKTNIGHLEAAAGIAGLIKTALTLQHRQMPPHLNLSRPNPHVDWDGIPIDPVTRLTSLPAGQLVGGVSSFGFGGSNAHAVLEAADPAPVTSEPPARPVQMLTLSARSAAALKRLAEATAEAAKTSATASDFADYCHSANTGRSDFEHRLALRATDGADAAERLSRWLGGSAADGVSNHALVAGQASDLAFLFSGQGAQMAGMGRQLYDTHPVFRDSIDASSAHVGDRLGAPLTDLMWGAATDRLSDTSVTQPALYAFEVALARLWMSFGVRPTMVLGHSVGEFAAAHIAGLFSLEDGLELTLARGRLMAELCPTGAMLAVSCSEETALALVAGDEAEASLAAVNSQEDIVLAGSFDAIDRIAERANARGLRSRRLDVSHAFHSALMEPALDAFAEVASGVRFARPSVPILSNVTGKRAGADEMATPDYWTRHIRQTVRFGDTVAAAKQMGAVNFLEIGPRPVLLAAARRMLGEDPALRFLPSLQPPAGDWSRLLDSLGALYAAGVSVDWAGFDAAAPRAKVALPPYPFDHARYWKEFETSDLAPGEVPAGQRDLHSAPAVSTQTPQADPAERRIEDFLYGLSWVAQKPPVLPAAIPGKVLVLADGSGVADRLAQVLRGTDTQVVLARPGADFAKDGDDFILRPDAVEDYAALLDAIPGGLAGILHLWSLDADPADPMAAQALGYASAFRLGQAIAERGERAPEMMALVTRGAQSTGAGDPVPGFAQGTMWGLGRVFAMELPQIRNVLVDLAPTPDDAEATWLAASLFGTRSETLLSHRDGAGRVARLNRKRDLPPIAPAEDGAWLITGGLGGIGLDLTDWLATQGVTKIALVGRSAPKASARERIADLVDNGVDLMVLQADVTDADEAARIAGAARDRFGPLTGLVHAAGVMDNASLPDLDWPRCQAVLAPKLAGAWNMAQATQSDPLQHIVLFSSASSLLGSPGHGNYAPANAALDALAGHLRGQGRPAVAVNWGPWAGTGMAAQLTGEVRARWDAMGIWGSLETDEALDGLSRVFAAPDAQLAVMPTDWTRFFQVFPVGLEPPFLEELARQVDRLGPPSAEWTALLDKAATLRPELRRDLVADFLEAEVAAIMSLPSGTPIDHAAGFFDIGLDSLMTVELRARLQQAVGNTLALPVTLAFDHPSIDRLAEWFDARAGLSALAAAPAAPVTQRVDADAPIAIVGIGCKFPGQAEDAASFWANLTAGRNCITEVPPMRWDVDAFHDPDPEVPGRMITRYGGFVDGIEQFDAPFFGVSPREAVQLDPQQRMLLETAWKAIEDAGQPVERLRARATGVFVGISINDYSQVLARSGDPARLDAYLGVGNATSMAAGRVAHFMGLEGPAIAIDTACSSSLTSIHMACEALRRGDCHTALAGGVNSVLAPEINVSLSKARMLAPDGRCKTFDASADGYVRGEGCGMVVLKRLDEAQADGDDIIAVIRASAVNHDGRASGLTVPNGVAQERLLKEVLDRAGLTAGEVDYIEAHGTGTPLGDPIEVQAVAAVYGRDRAAEAPVLIGTVKTNIGHLESAAGVAGVIKTALALRHGTLPASLHFQDPNPRIDWASMPVQVVDAARPFPGRGRPARAAVSSFGFSGTNAHMILEAAPARPAPAPASDRPAHLMTLSARTPAALAALAGDVAEAVTATGAPPLADLCAAANHGRSALPFRISAAAGSATEMSAQLVEAARTPTDARTVQNRFAMLFSGQGAQVAGMGQGLYAAEPRFAEALDRVAAALDPHLDRPLKQLLWEDGPEVLAQTEYTQPALFAVEYALAETWKAWGVTPRLLIGHSIGEYAVAVQAGVMTLDDAARLVAARGRLMRDLCPTGEMLALACPAAEARAILEATGGALALAAVNGPHSCVLSGAPEAIAEAARQAEARGLRATRLDVSHAFHSPLMEPMLEAFEEVARSVDFAPAGAEVISTLTGRKIAPDEMSEPGYWVRQIREPVLFADAVRTAAGLGMGAFVEVGPKPVLLGLVKSGDLAAKAETLPSLIPDRDETATMLDALGRLWTRGAEVDWRAFDAPFARQPAKLPGTRFERQPYWPDVPPARPESAAPVAAPVSAERIFPGQRIVSPALKGTLHTTTYDLHLPRFLDDHRIYGMIVVPGAAHLSMALTAVAQDMPGQALGLEAVNFDEVLVVPDDATRDVQIMLTPEETRRGFEVFSRAAEGDDWIRHAWGAVETTPGPLPAEAPDLDAIRARCKTEIASTDIFYRMLYRQGIQLGRQFQWVERIWKGDHEAIAWLRPPEPGDEPDNYFIPPGLLDSIFQSMGATLSTKELEAGAYIPISIENLVITAPPPGRLINHVRLRPTDPARPELRVSDMSVVDEAGNLVAEVTGLRIHRAPREALRRFAQRHLRDAIFAPIWAERPAATPSGSLQGSSWLVFGDGGDGTEALTARLMAEDVTCRTVLPGAAFATGEDFTIRPDHPEDYAALLEAAPKDGPVDGIAFLWPADFPPSSDTPLAVEAAVSTGTMALLHLSRALAARRAEGVPRLVVATRGAQDVISDDPAVTLGDSGIWGLARVIANELPESRTLRIDLPAGADSDVSADYLALAMDTADEDDEIAFRDGRRFALRLARWAETRGAADGGVDLGKPYQLIRAESGLLEEMKLAEVERPAPAPDEIEVLSDAAGLNFRDVLNALAVYPGDAGPMGGETVGTVTAVGAAVTGFRPGDRVMAIGAGTFARHVVTKAAMARKLPDSMTVEDAATIPVAYVSAWLGLVDMAGVRPGDRVLVHAGAGGVGMAAIMLAQHFGAEVYATASPAKHGVLRDMGVTHIYNSRTLEFAEQIMADTDGHGVDIVLNALANDFIPKSVGVTAQNGRFIEIGKNRTWSHEQMAAERPDITYHKMALDEIIVGDPADVGRMLGECAELIEAGKVKPLPRHEFEITEALDAFRFMQQAKHVGKVIFSFPHEARTEVPIVRADRAYLVTGGFGAIGLRLAARLAELGAGRIALMSRSAPKAQAQAAIEALKAEGAQVEVLQGDVTDESSMAGALAMLRDMGLPVAGVFHAAGILDDAALTDMDAERFRRVLDAKLAGAVTLHRATLDDPIEHFVMFSSAAALFGTPGQSNYAAANGALDALAQYRRGQGLPALSVNWGPWAEAGMAHTVDSGVERLWAAMGIRAIAPKSAFDTLELLMQSGATQALVLNADWDRMQERFPTGRPPRMIIDLVSGETGQGGPSPEWQALMERLAGVTPAERQPMLTQALRGMAARILGLPSAEALDPHTALNELGLDSLMAVEFANQLSAQSGLKLRVTELFDHPTIDGLSTYLLGLAMPEEEEAPEPEAFDLDDEELPSDLFDAVADLSDSEVAERLKELDDS